MLLAVAVGLALADSSVVTLALPDLLTRFDVEITTVAWVLTSYNLVLAGTAVPAAYLARRRPAVTFVAGALVFAAASLGCGLAGTFGVLVGARCVQAAGGALVIVAALDLLTESEDSHARVPVSVPHPPRERGGRAPRRPRVHVPVRNAEEEPRSG